MQLNLKRPIIFFDLETTGTNVTQDRIVEISLIKVMPSAAVAAAVSEPFYGDSAASRHNRRGSHRKKKPSARKSAPVAPRSPLDEPIRRDR